MILEELLRRIEAIRNNVRQIEGTNPEAIALYQCLLLEDIRWALTELVQFEHGKLQQ